MIRLRRSADRRSFDHGWLDTRHTFSFGDYRDPDWMGFGPLRVINEDRVAPGAGFPKHPHRDMEIVSYVIEGALAHSDSSGGDGVLRRGQAQRMTAGAGVTHSEFNGSKTEPAHFLQIWIKPATLGLPPGYEQKSFDVSTPRDELALIASPDGRDGSMTIHQDATIAAGTLKAGAEVRLPIHPRRGVWAQVVSGDVRVAGESLTAGDGVGVTDETELMIDAMSPAEVMVFDVPISA